MPIGPGKYGAHAEQILKEIGGDLCLVILTGPDGPAFDVATTNPVMLASIPGILRAVADSIATELESDVDRVIFGGKE